MIKNLSLFIPLIFIAAGMKAQTKDSADQNRTYSAYELLSSYYENDFKPFKKGTFYTGFSMALEDRQSENTENIFQKTIEGDKVNFDLAVKAGYYLSDYGMIGLNFSIYEKRFEGILFKDPDNLETKSITRGFSVTPNYRTTLPLTANERLSFFTTLGVTLGKSNTLKRETKNFDEIQKSFTENYNLRAGLSPGISFFAMENFALEVQLDVLGYELNVENKTINDVKKSRDVRQNVDFKLNILSVKVGLAYYMMNNKIRRK